MMLTEEDHTTAAVGGCDGKQTSAKMDWDINDNHFPKLQQVKNCANCESSLFPLRSETPVSHLLLGESLFSFPALCLR